MATPTNPSGDGSGYYLFLAEPDDDLKCSVCNVVAREPLQHESCGKLFCKQCVEDYGRDKPCPNCQIEKALYYADKRGNLEICVFLFSHS